MCRNNKIFDENFKIRHLLVGSIVVGLFAYALILGMALLPAIIIGPLQ